jgi:phage terminase Nu1 subunit (DNA packaging protein)
MSAALSARDLAAELGVDLRTVRRWTAAGLPHETLPGGRYLFDLEAARAWRRGGAAPSESTTPSAPAPSAESETLASAQRRKEAAIADRRELEVAELRGKLLDVAVVRSVLADAFANLRRRLLALPDRLGAELAGADRVTVTDRLGAELTATLEVLAADPFGRAESEVHIHG